VKLRILITGGAGFIGTNAANYFSRQGHSVSILDDLSRKGAQLNLDWLVKNHPRINFRVISVTDADAVNAFIQDEKPDVILHLAAQVAVTKSIIDPVHDFRVNVLGTVNVLEGMRKHAPNAKLIYASTNKVYGDLSSVELDEHVKRYAGKVILAISEQMPLDFYSPYGCSKGSADQYVLDYGRIYGLQTMSFRQSCIYGPRQFGIEDQGWVAWFTIATLLSKHITVYGNGKQVRDLLFIDDLLELYEKAIFDDTVQPMAFNVGGGIENSASVLEVLKILENDFDFSPHFSFAKDRQGDQKLYISDITRAKVTFNWTPKTDVQEGMRQMIDWLKNNMDAVKGMQV
jgi:CDP-paratose 2-epimerase